MSDRKAIDRELDKKGIRECVWMALRYAQALEWHDLVDHLTVMLSDVEDRDPHAAPTKVGGS
jgi:hypothetical protein